MDKGLSRAYAEPDQVMKAHKGADMNQKSVQESGLFGHFSKSDVRYWQPRIFHQSYTRNGKTLLTKDWAMKIAHEGRRETFPLGTPNKAAAAARARPRRPDLHRVSRGWLQASDVAGNKPWRTKAARRYVEQMVMTPRSVGGILLADDLV